MTQSSVWLIDDLQMDATVQNGMACDANICTEWQFNANARFLTAGGSQVGSTLIPPTGSCYSSATDPNARLFKRCQSNAIGVSLSATQVRFTWTVSVKRSDGLWLNAWSATKTVPIS